MKDNQAVTLLSRRFPAKRAFVTGAGSGLGRAFADALGSAGWRLGLLDLSSERLAEAADAGRSSGAAVSCYAGDVASETFVAASVADFAGGAGGLDVMINNAGVAVAGPAESTPAADWRWIVDINLLGVAWGCQAAMPHMRAAGSGLILNIASSAGFASAPLMSAYNATKAGVISLTETLAGEFSGSGVQASVAMPGFFRTRLLETLRAPPEASGLAQRLMAGSGHEADVAARNILAAAAGGALYVVWPPEYRWLWRAKRWFPLWFLRRLGTLRDAQLARSNPPPR
jgi:NAD(P)-dependent dehydrogenase (short-subunit alcohol dehydrogenase family)